MILNIILLSYISVNDDSSSPRERGTSLMTTLPTLNGFPDQIEFQVKCFVVVALFSSAVLSVYVSQSIDIILVVPLT